MPRRRRGAFSHALATTPAPTAASSPFNDPSVRAVAHVAPANALVRRPTSRCGAVSHALATTPSSHGCLLAFRRPISARCRSHPVPHAPSQRRQSRPRDNSQLPRLPLPLFLPTFHQFGQPVGPPRPPGPRPRLLRRRRPSSSYYGRQPRGWFWSARAAEPRGSPTWPTASLALANTPCTRQRRTRLASVLCCGAGRAANFGVDHARWPGLCVVVCPDITAALPPQAGDGWHWSTADELEGGPDELPIACALAALFHSARLQDGPRSTEPPQSQRPWQRQTSTTRTRPAPTQQRPWMPPTTDSGRPSMSQSWQTRPRVCGPLTRACVTSGSACCLSPYGKRPPSPSRTPTPRIPPHHASPRPPRPRRNNSS